MAISTVSHHLFFLLKNLAYHWYIVCGVDTIQSLLILITTYFLKGFLKTMMIDQNKMYGEMNVNDKWQKCLESQMKTLSISYVGFVVLDWILLIVGNYMDDIDKYAFDCLYDVFLFAEDNDGVIFSFVHSLYFLTYSIIIWYVFYFCPLRYGLLAKSSAKDFNVDFNRTSYVNKKAGASSLVEDFMRDSQFAEVPTLSPTSTRRKLSHNMSEDGSRSFKKHELSPNRRTQSQFGATQIAMPRSPRIGDSQIQPRPEEINNSSVNGEGFFKTLNSNEDAATQKKKKKKYDMLNRPENTGSLIGDRHGSIF
jgi:hypothetical protein